MHCQALGSLYHLRLSTNPSDPQALDIRNRVRWVQDSGQCTCREKTLKGVRSSLSLMLYFWLHTYVMQTIKGTVK